MVELISQQVETCLPIQQTVQNWQWRGFQIKFTVAGVGQPLILVHGFGASIAHWRKNIPELAQHYQVFALDLLGFGQSEKPPVDYSLELWDSLLQDFWRVHVQHPAVWVGNSIGALLSLMVICHRPEMALGGVVLNLAGGLNHRPEELNLPLRLVMGAFAKLMATPVIGTFLFNRIRQPNQIRRTLQQVYGNPAAITDDLVMALYEPSCDRGARQVMSSILQAPAGPRVEELLPNLRRPLLVIWGATDPWTPISTGAIFQDLVDHPLHPEGAVEFVAIPETGHCPHDERPEVVNPLIVQWVKTLEVV
jgi:pimeloyl-ACP methyl ester carboxylesterase